MRSLHAETAPIKLTGAELAAPPPYNSKAKAKAKAKAGGDWIPL